MARLAIGISIGKNDLDIAAWYNMLKRNHLSLGIWTGYLILAYRSDIDLDIGTVSVVTESEKNESNLFFGSGNSLQNNQKHQKRGWNTKGSCGEFIEGSIILVSLYNKDAIYAFQQLKNMGFHYSSVVKMLIRRYLKFGNHNIPPTKNQLGTEASVVSLQTIDKSKLFAKTEDQKTMPEQGTNDLNQKKSDKKKISSVAQETQIAQESKNPLLSYI